MAQSFLKLSSFLTGNFLQGSIERISVDIIRFYVICCATFERIFLHSKTRVHNFQILNSQYVTKRRVL